MASLPLSGALEASLDRNEKSLRSKRHRFRAYSQPRAIPKGPPTSTELWTQPDLGAGRRASKALLLHLSSFWTCPNLDANVPAAWLSRCRPPPEFQPRADLPGLRSTDSAACGVQKSEPRSPRTQTRRGPVGNTRKVHVPPATPQERSRHPQPWDSGGEQTKLPWKMVLRV